MGGCGEIAYGGSGATMGSSRKGGVILPASFCSAGGRLITILSSLSSLLILFVVVSEGVYTPDFSQKEVVAMSGRSLYGPYSVIGHSGHHNMNEHLVKEKRTVEPIHLCGYRLLEAVRGLCRGNYVSFNRRSVPDMEDDEHKMEDSPTENSESSLQSFDPLLAQNGNHPRHHFRYRRNIIDECCIKACSVDEMLKYCGRSTTT